MDKRIAIVGAGAIGGYLGAFLTRDGRDVTLIDTWGEHVETMKRSGLRISGTQGDFAVDVNAVHLSDAQSIGDPYGVVIIAVKSYDTRWVAHLVKDLVEPTGMVVCAQNCMNDGLIASIVGHTRVVGCVLSGVGVAMWEPGTVARGGPPGRDRGHDVFRVGELTGMISGRIEQLADALRCIDDARVTTNIWGERWSKLATNACSHPVDAMTGLGSRRIGQNPSARLIQVHIVRETVMVGRALGYRTEPIRGLAADEWEEAQDGEAIEALSSRFESGPGVSDWRSSMGQDVTKGRRTEIDFMNEYIADRGRDVGIPTPVNSAISEVVRGIDRGDILPDISNIDRTMELAGL